MPNLFYNAGSVKYVLATNSTGGLCHRKGVEVQSTPYFHKNIDYKIVGTYNNWFKLVALAIYLM